MNCPRCFENSEPGDARCGSCGFSLADLDALFGAEKAAMDRVTDTADSVSPREMRRLETKLDQFNEQFPQLFCGVYIGEIPDHATVSEFGCWLLNRAAVSEVDHSRTNDYGIMIVVDVSNCLLSVSLGYSLETMIATWELEKIFKEVRPFFAGELYAKGICVVVKHLRKLLRKKARIAAADPLRFQPPRPMLPAIGEKKLTQEIRSDS